MEIYTLKSCDTCKKAAKWLTENAFEFKSHDVRADGLDRNVVGKIVEAVGWERALNRRSTTWRQLEDTEKSAADASKAIELIIAHPTLLKRPVFILENEIIVGFDTDAKAKLQAAV